MTRAELTAMRKRRARERNESFSDEYDDEDDSDDNLEIDNNFVGIDRSTLDQTGIRLGNNKIGAEG